MLFTLYFPSETQLICMPNIVPVTVSFIYFLLISVPQIG